MNELALQGAYVLISVFLALLFYNRYKLNKETSTLFSVVIVGWSGLIYTNHFLGLIDTGSMYYLDWIVTTPLLVLSLSYVLEGRVRKEGILAAGLQACVIATGYLAYLSPDSAQSWFWIGNALLLGVFYYVYVMAKGNVRHSVPFLALIIITWIGYPYVWYSVGGDLSMAGTALVVLPFFSKHVFTYLKEVVYNK